jgi:hypothetical protein
VDPRTTLATLAKGQKRMKTMTIEAAVAWAVRDELPKVGADPLGKMVRAGAPNGCSSPALAAAMAGSMGGAIDARANRYGVVPDLAALDRLTAHPAALLIGEAMLGLDAIEPAGFAEWDAFEDIEDLAADPIAGPLLAQAKADARHQAGAMARMLGALSALMVKRAVLPMPRGWECGEVTVEVLKDHGKPRWFRQVARPAQWNEDGEVIATEMVEVDGYNAKAGRPFPDAYRKHRLSPDPLLVALARAEWQLWRAGLDVILEDCARPALEMGVRLMPSALPMRPWVEGLPACRIISGGAALAHERAQERPRAGAPLAQWQPSHKQGA